VIVKLKGSVKFCMSRVARLVQQNTVRCPSGYPDVESFGHNQYYISLENVEFSFVQGGP
jgi:hypothetical protein